MILLTIVVRASGLSWTQTTVSPLQPAELVSSYGSVHGVDRGPWVNRLWRDGRTGLRGRS
jgi:hypothetical protein